jgi:hypothetical protein
VLYTHKQGDNAQLHSYSILCIYPPRYMYTTVLGLLWEHKHGVVGIKHANRNSNIAAAAVTNKKEKEKEKKGKKPDSKKAGSGKDKERVRLPLYVVISVHSTNPSHRLLVEERVSLAESLRLQVNTCKSAETFRTCSHCYN